MNQLIREIEQQALVQHLRYVYAHSPFYRDLWQSSWCEEEPVLQDLPLVESKEYWQANQVDNNRLLTAPLAGAKVFKSGGTTGRPKFSFFSNADWKSFCSVFGEALRLGGMRADERVANLFYGGQLYASFLFISRSIEESGLGVAFPISGSAPAHEIIHTLQEFKIETLAGVPTTIMNLLPELAKVDPATLSIKRVIYGGETMYADQVQTLQKVLPGCEVRSIGIAGVDYGEMGFVDHSCEPGVHRCLDQSTVLELIDDEGHPIDEVGVEGRLFITNFKRKLMPIVRYPVGDKAMWLDEAGDTGRRFKLTGRSEEGARIGPITLYMEDLQYIIQQSASEVNAIAFQLVVSHFDDKDQGCLKIAVAEPDQVAAEVAQNLVATLAKERKMYADLLAQGVIHPLTVDWVTPDELITNPRTGKLLRVVDQRLQG